MAGTVRVKVGGKSYDVPWNRPEPPTQADLKQIEKDYQNGPPKKRSGLTLFGGTPVEAITPKKPEPTLEKGSRSPLPARGSGTYRTNVETRVLNDKEKEAIPKSLRSSEQRKGAQVPSKGPQQRNKASVTKGEAEAVRVRQSSIVPIEDIVGELNKAPELTGTEYVDPVTGAIRDTAGHLGGSASEFDKRIEEERKTRVPVNTSETARPITVTERLQQMPGTLENAMYRLDAEHAENPEWQARQRQGVRRILEYGVQNIPGVKESLAKGEDVRQVYKKLIAPVVVPQVGRTQVLEPSPGGVSDTQRPGGLFLQGPRPAEPSPDDVASHLEKYTGGDPAALSEMLRGDSYSSTFNESALVKDPLTAPNQRLGEFLVQQYGEAIRSIDPELGRPSTPYADVALNFLGDMIQQDEWMELMQNVMSKPVETAKGLYESVAFWQDVPGPERFDRFLNALVASAGVAAGANKLRSMLKDRGAIYRGSRDLEISENQMTEAIRSKLEKLDALAKDPSTTAGERTAAASAAAKIRGGKPAEQVQAEGAPQASQKGPQKVGADRDGNTVRPGDSVVVASSGEEMIITSIADDGVHLRRPNEMVSTTIAPFTDIVKPIPPAPEVKPTITGESTPATPDQPSSPVHAKGEDLKLVPPGDEPKRMADAYTDLLEGKAEPTTIDKLKAYGQRWTDIDRTIVFREDMAEAGYDLLKGEFNDQDVYAVKTPDGKLFYIGRFDRDEEEEGELPRPVNEALNAFEDLFDNNGKSQQEKSYRERSDKVDDFAIDLRDKYSVDSGVNDDVFVTGAQHNYDDGYTNIFYNGQFVMRYDPESGKYEIANRSVEIGTDQRIEGTIRPDDGEGLDTLLRDAEKVVKSLHEFYANPEYKSFAKSWTGLSAEDRLNLIKKVNWGKPVSTDKQREKIARTKAESLTAYQASLLYKQWAKGKSEQSEESPKEKQTDSKGRKLVGTNADGHPIYEDENGIRVYVKDGISHGELVAVSIRPGSKPALAGPREPEFMTDEERSEKKPAPPSNDDQIKSEPKTDAPSNDDQIKESKPEPKPEPKPAKPKDKEREVLGDMSMDEIEAMLGEHFGKGGTIDLGAGLNPRSMRTFAPDKGAGDGSNLSIPDDWSEPLKKLARELGNPKLAAGVWAYGKHLMEQGYTTGREWAFQFGEKVGDSIFDIAMTYYRSIREEFLESKLDYIDDQAKPESSGHMKLAEAVKNKLLAGEAFGWREIAAMAKDAFGGSEADGAHDAKDMYDSLEVGVNLYLKSRIEKSGVESARRYADAVLEMVPTQTNRTETQIKYQQFSTPPNEAVVATQALGLDLSGVRVLEPSAGTGSLANIARAFGAEVHTNEHPDSGGDLRAQLLKDQGFPVTRIDAQRIDARMPKMAGKFQAVLMNPPFSSSTKVTNNRTEFGAEHVSSALMMLAPGGRLVAIVGQGMGARTSKFHDWFKEMDRLGFKLRANILIDGDEYRKYGTTFDNRILVFDVKEEGKEYPAPIIEDSPISLEKTYDYTKALGNEKPAGSYGAAPAIESGEGAGGQEQSGADPGGSKPNTTNPGGRGPRGGSTKNWSGSRSGSGTRGGDAEPGVSDSELGSTDSESSEGLAGSGSDRGDGARGGETGSGRGNNQSGSKEVSDDLIEDTGKVQTDSEDAVFTPYEPEVKFGNAHPSPIVETKSLAGVTTPLAGMTKAQIADLVKVPKEAVTDGRVSDIQIESMLLAEYRHRQRLPDGSVAGMLVGDGTGVGKGREMAAIIFNNWSQGNRRIVWASANHHSLASAAKEDLEAVFGGNPPPVYTLDDVKIGKEINFKEGILIAGYDSLKGKKYTEVRDWLEKSSGAPLMLFDEAHKAAGAIATGRKPSILGTQVVQLQKDLPRARVVYATATAADKVRKYGYMVRLGLWGTGTPFDQFSDFEGFVANMGVAALELVARHLKGVGAFASRMIPFQHPDGTPMRFEEIVIEPNASMIDMYDKSAEQWRNAYRLVKDSLRTNKEKLSAFQRRNFEAAFWNAHQSFFKALVTAFKVPKLIEQIEKDVANGRQVVITLETTNESRMAAKLKEAEEKGLDISEIDFSNAGYLAELIKKFFPVQLTELIEPEDGGSPQPIPVWITVEGEYVTSVNKPEGASPAEDPQLVRNREAILAQIEDIKVPGNPLDMLVMHFGSSNVAELTGRSHQLVNDGQGGVKVQARSKPRGKEYGLDVNDWENQQFKDGVKKIAIVSRSAAQGISLHAGKNFKSGKSPRSHYTLELGWNTLNEIQKYGRSHRTNQESAPDVFLMSVDIGGEKRFSSSLAASLAMAGATQSGDRAGTAGASLAKYDFNSDEGIAAARRTIFAYEGSHRWLFNADEDLDGEKALKTFFNRMLALPVEEQRSLYDIFETIFGSMVDEAVANGTYGVAIKEVVIKDGRVTATQVAHEDSVTKTKAHMHWVEGEVLAEKLKWQSVLDIYVRDTSRRGFYINTAGNIVFGEEYSTILDNKPMIKLTRPNSKSTYHDISAVKNLTRIDPNEAKTRWEDSLAALPEYATERFALITGAMLPIAQRVQNALGLFERMQMVRVKVGDQYMVGAFVDADKIANVASELGLSFKVNTKNLKELWAVVRNMKQGEAIMLADGLAIRKRLHNGNEALYVEPAVGGEVRAQASKLISLGVNQVMVSFASRLLLPMAEATGFPVFEKVVKEYPIISTPWDEPDTPSSGEGGTQSLNAGMNPSSMFTIGVPGGHSGTVIVEQTIRRDFNLGDVFTTPLSIVNDLTGLKRVGMYERKGGDPGLAVSNMIYEHAVRTRTLVHEGNQKIDAILAFKERDRKLFNKKSKEHDEFFINLIELDRDDPARDSNGDLGKALELHDEMTDGFRDYIIEMRRSFGDLIEDDWGITEAGYFRHLFLGDLVIRDLGKNAIIGSAETYWQAQKIVMDYIADNPGAMIKIKARSHAPKDLTLRLTNRKFWKAIKNISDSVELDKDDIVEDLRGIVGRASAKRKFFGALIERKGAAGWMKDYERVMRLHVVQMVRSMELTALQKRVTPMIEQIEKTLPGLAAEMRKHIDALWAKPSDTEKAIGQSLAQTPILNMFVKGDGSMSFRHTVNIITSFHNALKLHLNVKSAAVNLLQPLTTLWPYVTTEEYKKAVEHALNPKMRKILKDKGVIGGDYKGPEGVDIKSNRTLIEHLSLFARASDFNRSVGYLLGYSKARRAGGNEEEAHQAGVRWAEATEFDTSVVNVQPIMRTPFGRLFFQYKSFMGKNFETIANLFKAQPAGGGGGKKPPGGGLLRALGGNPDKDHRAGRILKWFLAQGLIGGINGFGWLVKILVGAKAIVWLAEQFREAGYDDHESQVMAEGVMHGMPSLLGIDITGSVALFDGFYGRTPKEQIISFFGGPSVDALAAFGELASSWGKAPGKTELNPMYGEVELSEAEKQMRLDAIEKFVAKMSPGVRQWNAVKGLWETRKESMPGSLTPVGSGDHAIPLGVRASILKALGFRPMEEARYYEDKEYRSSIKNDLKRGGVPESEADAIVKEIPRRAAVVNKKTGELVGQ